MKGSSGCPFGLPDDQNNHGMGLNLPLGAFLRLPGLGYLLLGLAFLSGVPPLDADIREVRALTFMDAEPSPGGQSLGTVPLQDPRLGNYPLTRDSEPGQPFFYSASHPQAKAGITPSLWLFIRRFESLGIIIPNLNGPAIIYPFHSFL